MKKISTRFLMLLVLNAMSLCAFAQCGVGYSAAELNWDNIDFLPSNNTRYTSFYPSATFPYTQSFEIGTRTIAFTMAPTANITLNGENGTNTANALSPLVSNGDDVQFTTTSTSSTTLTMRLESDQANIRFSLFDLDAGQRVTITATNSGGVSQTVSCLKADGSSGITLGGTATAPTATGPGTNYGNSDTRGAINVSIGGPVQTIIITFSVAAGDIWLSDIDACVNGTFPNGYQIISRPFTNQPQYVLTVVNNNIYYTEPASGKSYFLFNEPGHDRLNSMAYDPYRRIVYYTYSLTNSPQTDKALKKYNVDTKTISVVIPNVNTFGIPTFESGVESGAATFYNGSLYLGIEGYTGTTGGGSYAASRKSTIWKIDFDASGNPISPASQVWGVLSDNGVNAQNIHDWSDFGITNGALYDFNGSASGIIGYKATNMMSGVTTSTTPIGALIPRQVSIGWDEKIYDVDNIIALFDNVASLGTAFTNTAPLGPTIPTGAAASWGDAAGPYRPFLDFGDAPGSYDPVALSPACHDTLTPNVAGKRTKLILGPGEDVEWLKKGTTSTEDTYEDGVAFVPIFSKTHGTYTAKVTALNNTGQVAKLCGWLDYNGNGIFDTGEGSAMVNVNSSALVQTFNLFWASTPSTLANGTFTYLRVRLTLSAMTTSDATGYYPTGEVEDYRVLVDDSVLPINMVSFLAVPNKNTAVDLSWSANEEGNFQGYQIERSNNGSDWDNVAFVATKHESGLASYTYRDNAAYKGRSWYRLRLIETGAPNKFSDTRMVTLGPLTAKLQISPNPANKEINLSIYNPATIQAPGQINISNMTGGLLYSEKRALASGGNEVNFVIPANWPNGTYVVQTMVAGEAHTDKFVLRR